MKCACCVPKPGMGQAKFTDSYHNDEFQTDAIFWNLDSAVLEPENIIQGVGKKPGYMRSVNYFNKELLRKTQGRCLIRTALRCLKTMR